MEITEKNEQDTSPSMDSPCCSREKTNGEPEDFWSSPSVRDSYRRRGLNNINSADRRQVTLWPLVDSFTRFIPAVISFYCRVVLPMSILFALLAVLYSGYTEFITPICNWLPNVTLPILCPHLGPPPTIYAIKYADLIDKVVAIKLSPPSLIYKQKTALKLLGHCIEARDDIEHRTMIVDAIDTYDKEALKTINDVIKFQAATEGSIDRIRLLVSSSIDASYSWKPSYYSDILGLLLEEIIEGVAYIEQIGRTLQFSLELTDAKLKTVANLTSKVLLTMKLPDQSPLERLWELVASSASISRSRYLENRQILSVVASSTEAAIHDIGEIVVLTQRFLQTLDNFKNSATKFVIIKPNSVQLEMLRQALERLMKIQDNFNNMTQYTIEGPKSGSVISLL